MGGGRAFELAKLMLLWVPVLRARWEEPVLSSRISGYSTVDSLKVVKAAGMAALSYRQHRICPCKAQGPHSLEREKRSRHQGVGHPLEVLSEALRRISYRDPQAARISLAIVPSSSGVENPPSFARSTIPVVDSG